MKISLWTCIFILSTSINHSLQLGFPTYLIFLWEETYFDISEIAYKKYFTHTKIAQFLIPRPHVFKNIIYDPNDSIPIHSKSQETTKFESSLGDIPDYKVKGKILLSIGHSMSEEYIPFECKKPKVKYPSLGYFIYQKKDSTEMGCFGISQDCTQ